MGGDEQEEMADRLRAVVLPFKNGKITEDLLRSVRASVVALLLELREKKELPKTIPTDVKVKQDGSTLNIIFPMKFRAWMELGDDALRPHFEHDCNRCIFLAHALGHDCYYCPRPAPFPTVIARASSVPSDYQSGLLIAEHMTEYEPLGLAYRLAVEDGHVKEG